ncbi:MAG: hypothetical protein CL623_06315 [Arcobacter sp.]|nr:hypothetical protein [Arcobacter sp.]|tara:strand:- start:4643 stop:5251 length:609 start_codon:yes stop_codon:yes gene_type:complete
MIEKDCINLIKEIINSYKKSENVSDIRLRIDLLEEVISKQLIKHKEPTNIDVTSQITSIIKLAKNSIFYSNRLYYLELIERCSKVSPWVIGYDIDDEYFNKNFGFSELIGPNGLFYSEKISCGFVLMGKNLNYPKHLHPAVELYEVILGPLEWKIEKNKFIAHQGELIHHRKNESHAMKTNEIPFLGIYTWIGEIETPSSFR